MPILPSIVMMALAPVPQGQASTLGDCRRIVDGPARLACFDTVVARMDRDGGLAADRTAESRLGLPADRSDRRDKAPKPPRIDRLDAVIRSVGTTANGYYSVDLGDDGLWAFTSEISPAPKPGDRIAIRSAALGSFMGSVAGRREGRIQRRR